MQPKIEHTKKKKLVGKRLMMSLINNRTGELWSSFIPLRRQIQNAVSNDLFSLQVHNPSYFNNYDPGVEFEKWALTEVADFQDVPEELETFILPEGLYAVFFL